MKKNKKENQPSELDGLKGLYHKTGESIEITKSGDKLKIITLSLTPKEKQQLRALAPEEVDERYQRFLRQLIRQFRSMSVICDYHIGITSGHRGEELEDEDLYCLIGKNGLMDSLIDTLYRKRSEGVDIPKICGELIDDLHELESLDEYYLRSIMEGEIKDTYALVKKTIDDFNRALSAYLEWEMLRGNPIKDDPDEGIDSRIENPMMVRYYLMVALKDFDTSHCEYHHGE